jgi:hypothetical protein
LKTLSGSDYSDQLIAQLMDAGQISADKTRQRPLLMPLKVWVVWHDWQFWPNSP